MKLDDLGYFTGMPLSRDDWHDAIGEGPDSLVMVRDTLPPGILLHQNFLEADTCDRIVAEADQQVGIAHTVGESHGNTIDIKPSDVRKSELIIISRLSVDIVAIVKSVYMKTVLPYFNAELDWFEQPEILKYTRGGEYIPHSDSENWDQNEKNWVRKIDRDLSILIYLNEGYLGGDLVFPNFGVRIAPRRGMLIAFPSDARYIHAAQPVKSGTRYALVSWAAAKGTSRVVSAAPIGAIRV